MANFFETDWEEPELDTLASLAQHLVYRLPECDDTVVRLTLREVYRDFCRRSCCLRVRRRFEWMPHGEYFVAPMFGGEVMRITEVCDGRHRLREGRDYTASGNRVKLNRCLWHVHAHRVCPPLRLTIAWTEMPSLSSEKIPKWLLKKHGDTMCSGALARLLAMTNRAWSDPQMAAVESNRYEAAVNEECMGLYAVGDSGNMGSVFDASDMI